MRCANYSLQVVEVRETETFSEWHSGLRDARAKAEIARRVHRLALGNPGDIRPSAITSASFGFTTALDTGTIMFSVGIS